ncbi:MAG: GDSL-type esterase/lipase family protein [Tepidisphaeraceae bacterium]
MNHALTRRRFGFGLLGCMSVLLCSSVMRAEDDRPVVSDKDFGKDATTAPASIPSIYFVGDSTMNSNKPLRGWASEVGAFFDPKKINVANRAIGGRSSKTYILEGKWDRVLGELKPGDFVVVQFGHNDVGRYDDPNAKGRPSLHGEGDDTAELKKADGTTETVHTFGWYMRKYGNDARAKGASVILCSMVPHKGWSKDGKNILRGERKDFIMWTKNAAAASGAAFVDLNEISALGMEKLGPPEVEKLFGDARTHSTPEGAVFNAKAFIAGTKALTPNPLEAFLSDAGKAIESADTSLATNAPATQPAH